MTVVTGPPVTAPPVTELLDALLAAPPGASGPAFHALTAALWDDGALTDAALPAVPLLTARMRGADARGRGHLAILLGLLAEAEYPEAGPVSAAVLAETDLYFTLLASAPRNGPLSLAVRYLLAHFPVLRERVLQAVAPLDLAADDMSRLDRALQALDPVGVSLGRVFPSPAVWTMDEREKAFDRAWIDALSPEQVSAFWHDDTRTVFGSTGAKAYWAVLNDSEVADLPMPELPDRATLPLPGTPDPAIFARHSAALRCPGCGGPLEFTAESATCAADGTRYPMGGGVLDLTAPVPDDAKDFQFKLAEMPSMGLFYESYARPNFLRMSGSDFGDSVTPEVEDAYIAEHIAPVDGPVLDMAAGAGRWTEVLADAVGPERVIPLDLNPPMLTALRVRLPELPAVLASAADLPVADASLGAVLCWNALQAFPEHAAAAVREAARCLKPGGVFCFLTFRASPDPVAAYFQRSHRFPQHDGGLKLFEPAEIDGWLADAGLRVRHRWTPGTFVVVTAEKPE
ncbi:class I SAM-dependent methyltransferase [Actinocorallia sp. A-T 12471]|uniref:class I SAM-dependent methyltransferase n=1 Tax=Actinocorallia sp. A-T 12471 TaxID=3089813 RepID=UPI0029CE9C17|nr:class I SAM-dependent methyltransferase [Actinocorallia sp. A-T 12471]MDX6741625.1 class I SAM-dependent methyltransferase [Actinocorallia sp. A-T 12471]